MRGSGSKPAKKVKIVTLSGFGLDLFGVDENGLHGCVLDDARFLNEILARLVREQSLSEDHVFHLMRVFLHRIFQVELPQELLGGDDNFKKDVLEQFEKAADFGNFLQSMFKHVFGEHDPKFTKKKDGSRTANNENLDSLLWPPLRRVGKELREQVLNSKEQQQGLIADQDPSKSKFGIIGWGRKSVQQLWKGMTAQVGAASDKALKETIESVFRSRGRQMGANWALLLENEVRDLSGICRAVTYAARALAAEHNLPLSAVADMVRMEVAKHFDNVVLANHVGI